MSASASFCPDRDTSSTTIPFATTLLVSASVHSLLQKVTAYVPEGTRVEGACTIASAKSAVSIMSVRNLASGTRLGRSHRADAGRQAGDHPAMIVDLPQVKGEMRYDVNQILGGLQPVVPDR